MRILSRSHAWDGRKQYAFTFFLPGIWLASMISIWVLVWHSEGVLVPMLAGLPGYWLPVILGVKENDLLLAITLCIGGIPVMVTLGVIQDYLRIWPAWMWAYLVGLVVTPLGFLVGMPLNLVSVLFCGCLGMYVVSILLCLGGGILRLRRGPQIIKPKS